MRAKPLVLAVVLMCTCVISPKLRAQSSAHESEMTKLRSAINELEDAYTRQDVNKIASMYTDDAIFLPDDAELFRGKAGIRKYIGAETGTRKFERQLVELKIDGNLAYEIANQVVTVRRAGQPPQIIRDKYLHLWKKQKDGSWKVLVDMYNWRPKPR